MIKKMPKKTEKPLEQLYNRISEMTDDFLTACKQSTTSPVLIKKCSQVLPIAAMSTE